MQIKNRHGRYSATFKTKREAAQWALQREAELTGAKLPDKSLKDALERYRDKVAPLHKGRRWEEMRLDNLATYPIAKLPMAAVTGTDVADWRDSRLEQVSPATVAREMTLLRSVFDVARTDWGWLKVNPMLEVKKPSAPASRKRRISAEEIDRMTTALDLVDGLEARTALQRTGLAFLFAIETAMRAGEILGLRWGDVAEKTVRLPDTKNGDARVVPLSPKAREIIGVLRAAGTEQVFDLHPGTRDVLWRKAVTAAKVSNLHFHDARAEAIWRLSKKLPLLDLARVVGHRNINSLQLYYNTSADELADRL